MSDYVDHNRKAAYGAEFFDFDAASGQYDEAMLSSDAVEDFGTGSIARDETWNDFSMTSNNDVASYDTFEGPATDEHCLDRNGTHAAIPTRQLDSIVQSARGAQPLDFRFQQFSE
jgi:hypothetical protein